MKTILVIHGPNLNLLGKREQEVYGSVTMDGINNALHAEAKQLGIELKIVQSNHEGEIVTLIGDAQNTSVDGILINPAAYTHTSVAIHDAVKGCSIPTVEVHLSNIYSREEFRHKSFTAPAVIGQVCGFGLQSYILGLRGLVEIVK
ncbi:MAG: type II 3-dehydroquinate dehydratase [Candidatus Omnitrophica bacterium]|nr:type II 3-dehydroquinate dehydratase [Candidatus Omnitrophota bacterium]